MREIKFRVWHKELKQMFDRSYIEELVGEPRGEYRSALLLTLEGELVIANWSISSLFHTSVFELMQYIDRKDKNGKEIYEGDIITGNTSFEMNNDEAEWTRDSPAIVKWNDKSTGFYPLVYNFRWRCDVENIEVIGNIYENPELVK